MCRLLLTLGFCSQVLCAQQQVDAESLSQKAVEAERRGDFAVAVSAFQELIREGSDSPELRTNLGLAYFQMRSFNAALGEFRVALVKTPNSVPANLFSGLCLLNLQDPKQALGYLERARRSSPFNPSVSIALARVEIALNNIVQARDLYGQTTRFERQNAEAWYGLGIADRVLAERELKKEVAAADSGPKHAVKKSRRLADESEQAISRAMQIDPSSVHARMILGESFRIAERYDLAIQEYKAVTEQQPSLAAAWAGLATAYSASGDDTQALNAATRALDLYPGDADTNALLAGTYLRMGDYAKAEPYAVRALELRKNLSSAEVVLAKIYLARRQPEKALNKLQDAVKDDRDGSTYYLLATTLKTLDKSSEAATAMRKYKQRHDIRVATMSDGRVGGR